MPHLTIAQRKRILRYLEGRNVAAKIYIYGMYGLGGRIWSAAIEDYVIESLRLIPGVIAPKTRGFSQWRSIAREIAGQPRGSKSVVIGHSMGASAATFVTDMVKVDLVVCYDAAGQACSGIGNNCGKLLDFHDTAFAIVPKYRPWAYPGHEKKITRTRVAFGHTRIPLSSSLIFKVESAVKELKT